jgi:hypothetical protein
LPYGKSYVIKTIRLLTSEDALITQACESLENIERAQLIAEAIITEAYRLGIRFSAAEPAPLKRRWPYAPERAGEVTGARISISLSLTVAELLSRAVKHVAISEAQFIVGATLAYVGRLQKTYSASEAETKEEGRAVCKALQRIKLPSQYEYRPKSRES